MGTIVTKDDDNFESDARNVGDQVSDCEADYVNVALAQTFASPKVNSINKYSHQVDNE